MRRVALLAAGALLVASCAGPGPAPASPTARPTSTVAAPEPAPTSAAPVATPEPVPPPAPAPAFSATSGPITAELVARMASSWRAGCPVPLEDLRYLSLTYLGFDGAVHPGELVVHADAVDATTRAFAALFEAGYPIRSMRLVDDFDADDDASMAADNTSAFNCRPVAGTSTWSEHSFGRAIDLNPVENPYVSRSGVFPPGGAEFASRPDVPGVIHRDDAVVHAFAAQGWGWGGGWTRAQDYQHFSATGR